MAEESEQLQELARRISEYLKGWTYQPCIKGVRVAKISVPDGATIIVSIGWRDKTKLDISGKYPVYKGSVYPMLGSNHRIRVSISKSPEQIAKDISRRLLPQYLEQYQKGIEIVRVCQERDENTSSLLYELQTLLPTLEISNTGDTVYLKTYTDTYMGEVLINDPDKETVDIKMNRIPLETAKGILRVLGGHRLGPY